VRTVFNRQFLIGGLVALAIFYFFGSRLPFFGPSAPPSSGS